jgi:hypothetical protein
MGKDNQSTYYVSPGIGIGWDLQSNWMLNLKLSFGKMVDEKYYYNLTVGKKFSLDKNINKGNNGYTHFEIQIGSFFEKYPLSSGFGLGIASFVQNQNNEIYPKISFFSGIGLFGTFEYVYKKNRIEFGIKGVLPIPFNESYRDFSQ